MARIIAPSVLSADFLNLGRDIEMLNQSKAEWIHLDIMDGLFVPNISFGLPVVQAIRKATTKTIDVHLMIEQPERYITAFADAGADVLTLHYEASRHLHRAMQQIRDAGMKAGVVLNPHTPVELLQDLLPYLDLVLLMSVNPGFGGQKFIPQILDKTVRLKKMIEKRGLEVLIEVDGGVNAETAVQLFDAGADVLVAGSYVFGSEDPQKTIERLLEV
ncbi:MAG: ribulose-phosphate 3-epimerase [Porphyromonas somerae]|uniref:ribulose-phosphate 3-epimerase n=1 Tax=Porphyromonas somerae TaxID=322095 RepID=UPI0026F0D6F6|nr:ribulose-phosphate 3-epimerase [Porphyromonas somerae]MDD7557350.1 ribulose-phosphate 3-epimerase [Porphyromonas somerae]MDY3884561.1 ribulose-phosphate 3-epimerase [Porphyromonas somerae]MDY5815250.1 ribulose-phosphate 3-epimerase [Porphyromonas somerae]